MQWLLLWLALPGSLQSLLPVINHQSKAATAAG
jgi:hypothetical protein